MLDPSKSGTILSGSTAGLTATQLQETGHHPNDFEIKQALLNPATLSMMSSLFPGLSGFPTVDGDSDNFNNGSQVVGSHTAATMSNSDKSSSIFTSANTSVMNPSPMNLLSLSSMPFDPAVYTAGLQAGHLPPGINGMPCPTPQLLNPFSSGDITTLNSEHMNMLKSSRLPTMPFPVNEQLSHSSETYSNLNMLDRKQHYSSASQMNQFLNGSGLDSVSFFGLRSELGKKDKLLTSQSVPSMQFSLVTPNKSDEDFCELCQKHFCNKYYLRKHKADVHGIHTEPYSQSRKRDTTSQTSGGFGFKGSPTLQHTNIAQRLSEERLSTECDSRTPTKVCSLQEASEQKLVQQTYTNTQTLNPLSSTVNSNIFIGTENMQTRHFNLSPTSANFHITNSAEKISPNTQHPSVHPMLTAHYYMMALANSLPFTKGGALQNGTGAEETASRLLEHNFQQNLLGMPFMPVRNLETEQANIHEVQCDQCQKVFCNQYFLQIHKLNQHNASEHEASAHIATSPNASVYPAQENLDRQDSDNSLTSNIQEKSSCSSPGFLSQVSSANHPSGSLRGHVNRASSESKQPANSLDAFRSSMVAAKLADRVTCELCKKELCNKYFLRTHKIRVHGISPKDVGGPPMRNPPQVSSTAAQIFGASSTQEAGNRSLQNTKPNQTNIVMQKEQPFSVNEASNNQISGFPLNSMFRMTPELPFTMSGFPLSMLATNGSVKNSNPTVSNSVTSIETNSSISAQQNRQSKNDDVKNWAKYLLESSRLPLPKNMNLEDTYSATNMICCPICEKPIGPRLFLPSHLSDAHGLNPIDPAFFLNMLRAKTIQQAGVQTGDTQSDDTTNQPNLKISKSEGISDCESMPVLLQEGKEQKINTMLKPASFFPTTLMQCDIAVSSSQNADNQSELVNIPSFNEKEKSPMCSPTTAPTTDKSSKAPEVQEGNQWGSNASFISDGNQSSSQELSSVKAKNVISPSDLAVCRSTSLDQPSHHNSNLPFLGINGEPGNMLPPGMSGLGLPSGPMGLTNPPSIATPLSAFPGSPMEAVAMAAALASAQWNPLSHLTGTNTSPKSIGTFGLPPSSMMTTPPLSSLNPNPGVPRKSPNQMRVLCDICNKWICNKYFLRTHKANKHGISDLSQMDLGKSQAVHSNSGGKSPLQTSARRSLEPLKEAMGVSELDSNGSNSRDEFGNDISKLNMSMGPFLMNQSSGVKDETFANGNTDQFTQAWKTYCESKELSSLQTQPPLGLLSFPFPLPNVAPPGLMAHLQSLAFGNSSVPPPYLPVNNNNLGMENQSNVTKQTILEHMDCDEGSNCGGSLENSTKTTSSCHQDFQDSRDPLNLSLKSSLGETIQEQRIRESQEKFELKQRIQKVIPALGVALKYLQRARATQHFHIQWLRTGDRSQRGRAQLVSSNWKRVKMLSGVSHSSTSSQRSRHRKLRHRGMPVFSAPEAAINESNLGKPLPSVSEASRNSHTLLHSADTEPQENLNLDTKLYCPICSPTLSSEFLNLNQLLQHLALVHGNQSSQNHSGVQDEVFPTTVSSTEQLSVCTKQQQSGFQVSDLTCSSSSDNVPSTTNGKMDSSDPDVEIDNENYRRTRSNFAAESSCILTPAPLPSVISIRQSKELHSRRTFIPVSSYSERQPAV